MNSLTFENAIDLCNDMCLTSSDLVANRAEPTFDIPAGVQYKYGCSKIVFVCADKDEVLKIPCSMMQDEEYENPDDSHSSSVTEEVSTRLDISSTFFPVEHESNTTYSYSVESKSVESKSVSSNFTELSFNYCKREVDIYNDAVAFGVESFFCKPSYLGKFREIELYSQERCAHCGAYSTKKHPSNESLNQLDHILNSRDKFHMLHSWTFDASIIDFYGQEFYSKLLDFVCDNITDIHGNNIGYRENGSPCIFDFSGFMY